MTSRIVSAAGVALAAAGLGLWISGSFTSGPDAPPTAPLHDAVAGKVADDDEADRRSDIAAALRAAAAPDARAWPPPASLRDTEVDGALALDVDGQLIVAPPVRRFFEYFYVASGEEDEVRIRARIEAEIRARLDGEAQQAAFDLLDRYLVYRQRGRAVAAALPPDGDLEARVDVLRRLRDEVFGARDAGALFADEEAAYAVAVAQRRLAADPALTDDQRAAQIAALEAQLPDGVRAARAAVTAPLRLAREEAALREAGGSTEEIQALREQSVGRDAADRLAALDQRRAEWQGRVDAYRSARAAIEADASLTAAQREAGLEALRTGHFDDSELMRVRALDRIEAAGR